MKSIIYKAHIAKKTTKWTCKTAKIKLMIDTPTHYHTPTHRHTHFDASYENAEFDTILRTWRANKFKMHIIVVKKSNFDEVKKK